MPWLLAPHKNTTLIPAPPPPTDRPTHRRGFCIAARTRKDFLPPPSFPQKTKQATTHSAPLAPLAAALAAGRKNTPVSPPLPCTSAAAPKIKKVGRKIKR